MNSSLPMGAARRAPVLRICVVLLVVGLGVVLGVRHLRQGAALVVQTLPVTRGVVQQQVSAASAGEVHAKRHAVVRSIAGGRVTGVWVRPGDLMGAGVVAVRLDTRVLDAKVVEAQAALAARRSDWLQARGVEAHTALNAKRSRHLAKRGAETVGEAEDAEARGRGATLDVQGAQARMEQAAAHLLGTQQQVNAAKLTAPFAGVVARVAVNEGDDITPGAAVFELVDDGALHVLAHLDESDAGAVQVGQEAVLRCDALGDAPLFGTVLRLDPTVQRDQKGVRTLGIEVALNDTAAAKARGLRPGMSANVDVHVGSSQPGLAVPTHLVAGQAAQRTVWVLRGGQLREISVTTGVTNWQHTEILSGLQEDDCVVVANGAQILRDGAAARPAS